MAEILGAIKRLNGVRLVQHMGAEAMPGHGLRMDGQLLLKWSVHAQKWTVHEQLSLFAMDV